MPSLVQTAEFQRNHAVLNQYGSRVFTRPQEGADGYTFPGNQLFMASSFPFPGLGPTPVTHEGRLDAPFATPLYGQPELPSASFNAYLRPTQSEETRDYGLQSFVRMKQSGEITEFRRLSPSDGRGELFYFKGAGRITDVGESAAQTSGGQMFPVSWQAEAERQTITPAVFAVSGYTIPAAAGAFTIAAGNISRVGGALPVINGARITEAQLGLPTLAVSNDATGVAVMLTMSGAGFADFSSTPSTTPIRARLFADGIWEEWSADLADQDVSGAFAITTAAEGLAFANALAAYRDANDQVPTFYVAIYGESEL